MSYVNINWLAVIIATIASMVIGGAWYSPALFGKQWMKLVGTSQKEIDSQKKEMPKFYLAAFVAAFITAYVLAIFVKFVGASTIFSGAVVGFWAWLGFVATTTLSLVIWEKRNSNLYVLNNGQILISLLAMGPILAVWP